MLYPWDQNSLGTTGPLDGVSLEHLQRRFIAIVKVEPGLAAANTKHLTRVLGLLNHALEAHPPNRHSEATSSLLRAMKLWHIVPAPLHSHDSRVKQPELRASVERGDITLILPRLMGYTTRASTRLRHSIYEAIDAAKYEIASSARRHSGGVSVATLSLLVEPRAPGDEMTWKRVIAKFPREHRASVSEAAAAAVAASSTEPEEGSVSDWCLEE